MSGRKEQVVRISRLQLAREFKGGLSMVGLARKYGLSTGMVEQAIRFVNRLSRANGKRLGAWTALRKVKR